MTRSTVPIGWFLVSVAVVVPLIARAAHGDHVVVSEVQVGGASAKDEFVELYNPTAAAIPLEWWRLSKRTASGSESNLLTTFPAMAIAPHASVLIAPSDGAFGSQADAAYSTTASLASDNALVLYAPLADSIRPVVDLVAWGTAVGEGTAAANPIASTSLERKPGGADGNVTDTGDNAADFAVREAPTPQNASVAARPASEAPPPPPPPPEEGESGTGTTPSDDSSTPLPTATPSTSSTTPPETTDTSTPTAPPPSTSPLVEPSRAPPPPQPKHVRMNEFVSDPADGDVEWVELVNTGPNAVNLAEWVLEDGAEARTILTGALPIGGFVVITSPKGKLNNDGDRLVLRQPDGTTVDTVAYGSWDDGKASDNAPAAADPASVARVTDGGDTDNDRADWVRTETPTRGFPNVIASVPDTTAPPSGAATAGGSTPTATSRAIIVLNELMPDPPGEDASGEFIELANVGGTGADLTGWRLTDELGTEYALTRADGPTEIPAGGVLALARTRTGIALNNTGGETVRLLKPDADRATSVAQWSGTASEGQAWARGTDGRWRWTTTPTAGDVNRITTPNQPPDAVIAGPASVTPGAVAVFDASDSADPDGDALTYLWDFGDGTTEADVAISSVGRYVYGVAGTYTVTLAVTDARGASVTTKHRVAVGSTPQLNSASVEWSHATSATTDQPINRSTDSLRLSELLPNPEGADADGEWIELENLGNAPVALAGWELVVRGSTERRAPLPADIVVAAQAFLVIPRAAVGVALRNDRATVELFDPAGEVADSTTYERSREGWSFARVSGADAGNRALPPGDAAWQWTSAPTPGAPNAVVAGVRVDSAGRSRTTTPSDSPSSRARGSLSRGKVEGERQAFVVPISEIDDVARGEIVAIRGRVTAPLGAVGSQIFYVADAGGRGVQVFVGKRAIPSFVSGAAVAVVGELRIANGEPRVGIRTPADVRVEADAPLPVEPRTFRLADASDAALGDLVAFTGEVMEVRGRVVHVDDGSDELRVALPADAGDAAEAVAEGDTVRIAGILSKTQAGYRVLARSADDVAVVQRAAAQMSADANAPTAASPRRTVELVVLSGIAFAVALPFFWRRRAALAALVTRVRARRE